MGELQDLNDLAVGRRGSAVTELDGAGSRGEN